MAVSCVRKGISSLNGLAKGCSFLTPTSVVRPQVATIISKTLRGDDYKRPSPYPYKEAGYGLLQAYIDRTTHRFDENSRIIVVDGPIASGKSKFAKEVADELDMLYIPEANSDMYYINEYGYDLRQLDPKMPASCKSFDEKNFLATPNHTLVASFQMRMNVLRLTQYIDALAHLLNTGQGVVMDRSVFSDFVFAETLVKFGYMRKRALEGYYECRKMTLPSLMRPHLVVYLDVPVDVTLENIKARNLPHEINSSVLTPEYLGYMETVYKQHYLKEISVHSEILVYDWSEGGDAEVAVEDMESIKFDFEDKHDPKFVDWKLIDENEWCEKRILFTKHKQRILQWLNVPYFDIDELIISANDFKIFNEVWNSAPGNKFAKGYNKDMGDEFLLTKVTSEV